MEPWDLDRRASRLEGGCSLVRKSERWKERGIDDQVLKADRVLSLAQGAYVDSMTFFPGTRFYT